jgi:hypothetical protein
VPSGAGSAFTIPRYRHIAFPSRARASGFSFEEGSSAGMKKQKSEKHDAQHWTPIVPSLFPEIKSLAELSPLKRVS